ncbi:MAG: roadblock/LC7 domain-containing protein [Thermoplasmata archaeon]
MMKETNIQEKLLQAMEYLRNVEGVRGVALARRDGLLIESLVPAEVDPRQLAATCATIVGSSEQVSRDLSQGPFHKALLEYNDGQVITLGLGEMAFLIAMIQRNLNLGLVLLELDRVSRDITTILEEF